MARSGRRLLIVLAVLGCFSCGDDDSPGDAAIFDAATADATVSDATVSDAGPQTACGPSLLCDDASQICVQDIGIVTSYRCDPVPVGCEVDRSCGCAGSALCGATIPCNDVPADNTIECCPKC